MGSILRRGWARLWVSRLLVFAIIWCAFGLASYFFVSRALLDPWQQRVASFNQLDIGTLRLLLVTAQQNGTLPMLVVLFLVRLLLNPVVDAFVFSCLSQSGSPPLGSFYRSYLLYYLGLVLLGWLAILASAALLRTLSLHPFLFVLLLFGGIFLFALWFGVYRARLVMPAAGFSWPKPLAWLQLALARLLIIVLAGMASFWLHRWIIDLGGFRLILALLLAELLVFWARLWQASCAVEVVSVRIK